MSNIITLSTKPLTPEQEEMFERAFEDAFNEDDAEVNTE